MKYIIFNFFRKIFHKKFILILLIILAFALRSIGVYPGYPNYHEDEGWMHSGAAEMIKNSSLLPDSFEYPETSRLINLIIFKLVLIPFYSLRYYILDINNILNGNIRFEFGGNYNIFLDNVVFNRYLNTLYWSRYITAIIGTGIVVLGYLIAKKLFSHMVGLFSALLIAVNYRQVLNSHFALPDIYNAFFLALAFYYTLILRDKKSFKNYIICSILVGISIATKYQLFAILPLLFVHLEYSLLQRGLKDKIKSFLSLKFLVTPFIVLLSFIAINPYFFPNLDKALYQISDAVGRYRVGIMRLNFYSFSYLYHIGIGPVTSIVLIIGILFGLFKNNRKSLLLLSAIGPFFFFTSYYTGAGFFTRNFVTITPLLLLFVALAADSVRQLNFKAAKYFALFLLVLLIWENLSKSLILIREYQKPWNVSTFSSEMIREVPEGSKLALSEGFPDLIRNSTRVAVGFDGKLTEEEMREAGAEYYVFRSEWINSAFLSWMSRYNNNPLQFWDKPIAMLNQTSLAMAQKELSNSTIFAVTKPWQAPETNFFLTKIPRYNLNKEEEIRSYDFRLGLQGWKQEGILWPEDNNLTYSEGSLVINKFPVKSEILRWESEPLSVNNWKGFKVAYTTKTISAEKSFHDGFLFVSFYSSLEDARRNEHRISTRLGIRNEASGQWLNKELIGLIPAEAGFIRIGFQSFLPKESTAYLKSVKIYKADVGIDYHGVKLVNYRIDDDILFPYSQGNM